MSHQTNGRTQQIIGGAVLSIRATTINSTLALALVVSVGLSPTASATPRDKPGTVKSSSVTGNAISPPYSPQPGILFNDPTGSVAEQYSIKTHINRSIAATLTGATIRISTYTFGFDDTVNELIAAKARGVNVQVLIDSHTTTSQTTRLTNSLGTDRSKGSFVRRCSQGCMSSNPSVMHAKMYLFSMAGSSNLVSMVSSANLSSSSAANSWNNINTVVGNPTLYNSLAKYFDDMLRDVDDLDYFRTTTSGIHKLYFYPRAAVTGVNTVTMLDVLNHVKCTGSSSGFGYQGRTIIRVAMFQWAGSRLDLANKVRQLRDQGCVVQVITNVPLAGPGIMQALLQQSSRYGIMPVYDALYDNDKNGVADLYVHHKVLTINGNWYGNTRSKLVYTGSQNFTDNSTRNNNEIIYRIADVASYSSYAANIINLRTNHAKRIYTVPAQKLTAADTTQLVSDEVVEK